MARSFPFELGLSGEFALLDGHQVDYVLMSMTTLEQALQKGFNNRYQVVFSGNELRVPVAMAVHQQDPMLQQILTKVLLSIRPEEITIARILAKAGYHCGHFGKWHLGLGEGKPNWNGDLKPGPLDIGAKLVEHLKKPFYDNGPNDKGLSHKHVIEGVRYSHKSSSIPVQTFCAG